MSEAKQSIIVIISFIKCNKKSLERRSYLHRQVSPPDTQWKEELFGRKKAGNFDRELRLPRIHFRVLLHAANMGHGTKGFTSLPKDGVLRIFSPWKIQRLRPGLNPRTWVPKVSTLSLDHRSRLWSTYFFVIEINLYCSILQNHNDFKLKPNCKFFCRCYASDISTTWSYWEFQFNVVCVCVCVCR